MLRKTLIVGEIVFLQVSSSRGEALVLTQSRIIILKAAQRDPAGRGYGRFFRIDEIARFAFRGLFRPTFIAVITAATARETIPILQPWKCTFGVTVAGTVGKDTVQYLRSVEMWLAAQRRTTILRSPLVPITPSGVAIQGREEFFLQVPASLYAEHTVREYSGGSTGWSIPVVRGVRFRVGQSRGRVTSSNVLGQDDVGTLIIGDCRVVFVGNRRLVSIPLPAISSVDVFANGLNIGVPNKLLTQFRTENEIPGLLLKRLLKIP